MVSDDFLPAMTGVGHHLQLVARELIGRGHTVLIVTSRRKGQPKIEDWNGVTVFRIFSVKIAGFYQVIARSRNIRKIILENQIQIIHHHYLSFLLKTVFTVGGDLGIPQIYTYHMSDQLLTQPLFMRPLRPFIRWLAFRQYSRFSKIISPSKSIALELAKEGIKTEIEVISNPISLDEVSQAGSTLVENDKFKVFFAGRLAPEKNIPLLLRAFSELQRDKISAILWIAGEGPLYEYLFKLTESLGISGQVSFLGHLDKNKLSQHYAGCDVFVLPSVLEVQGIVALEAMRFGKPVIMTSAAACSRELIEEGGNGFIVDAYDEGELSSRLKTLARSASLRHTMGQSSFKKAQEFEPETILQRLISVYTNVVV